MTPAKYITLNYTSDGVSEELTYTLTKRIKKLNNDSEDESKDHVVNLECKEEVELHSTSATVVSSDCLHNEVQNLNNEEESKPVVTELVKEKPAAIYILNTEEWESLRRDLEECNITYTSARNIRDEIEIKVADKNEHLKLIIYLLANGIQHKTFINRDIGELPEYMQEMRQRKNKACRDCQKYPTKELKHLANSLTRDYKRELANLRYNQYENIKEIFALLQVQD